MSTESSAADRIAELEAELTRIKRGAKTLGGIVDWQCRAVVDATDTRRLLDKDGDGDWGYVWERMTDLCAKGLAAEAQTVDSLAKTIWQASRADEGSISATGARRLASAVLAEITTSTPTATPAGDTTGAGA